MSSQGAGRLTKVVIALAHRGYKLFVSPLFGNACRFHPYCSDYAREAIEKHGAFKGAWLAALRLFRCNPWNRGGFDPVP